MVDRTRTALAMLAFVVMAAGSSLPAAAQDIEPAVVVDAPPPADSAVETAPDEASVQTVLEEIAVDTADETAPEEPRVDKAVEAVPDPHPLDEALVDTAVTTAPGEPADEPAARTARDEASADPAIETAQDEPDAVASDESADDEEGSRSASAEVKQVIAWVNASGDNAGLPFIVIDKAAALVFVFDADGTFLAATPALLGSALGDDSTPGIGDVKLSDIPKEERVTPAGRFLAAFGYAAGDRKVLWVDFETAISLHPVVTANRAERRLDRLYSASAADNRITYGCINIPAAFYEHLVRPLFTDTSGVVYILPEIHALDEVFPTVHARAPAAPREGAVTASASAEDPVAGEAGLLHAH